MNEQDTIKAVMAQARDECVAQAPDDPTESELSAMYTRRAFIICERRQDALEATQAKLSEAIAREQLWSYSTPEKPEGWASADEMIRVTFDEIEGSRSRRCLMRGVATVAEYAEMNDIETDAAVGEWGKFRDMLPEMKRACLDNDREQLTSILTDVVEIPDRESLRDKYKDSDKPSAGSYGVHALDDGTPAVLILATDMERILSAIGKMCKKELIVEAKTKDGVITVRAFEQETVGDLWQGVVVEDEPELEPVPR